MAIKRLHFDGGLSFGGGQASAWDSVMRALLEHLYEIEVLKEGVYDFTPDWALLSFKPELTVLSDGTGLYRAIPRARGARMKELTPSGTKELDPGGKTLRIPGDQEIVAVSVSDMLSDAHKIMDLVFFSPSKLDKALAEIKAGREGRGLI